MDVRLIGVMAIGQSFIFRSSTAGELITAMADCGNMVLQEKLD